jgi:hypothetical protein
MMYCMLATCTTASIIAKIGATRMLEAFRSISTFAKCKSTKTTLLLVACCFLYSNVPNSPSLLIRAVKAHFDFIVMAMLLLSDFLDGHFEIPLVIVVACQYDFRAMFGLTRLLLLRGMRTKRAPVEAQALI